MVAPAASSLPPPSVAENGAFNAAFNAAVHAANAPPPPRQAMNANANANERELDCNRRYDACLFSVVHAVWHCYNPCGERGREFRREFVRPMEVRVMTAQDERDEEIRARSIEIVTFPCDGNPCCIPFDIVTLCHGCSGSISCNARPTRYDCCCPSLLPPYLMAGNEEESFCCNQPVAMSCAWPSEAFRDRAAASFKRGELTPSPQVESNRRRLAYLHEGAPPDPQQIPDGVD